MSALNAQRMSDRFRGFLPVVVDIETGGHVFQLHFTNSTTMTDKGVISETVDAWEDGDFHFGFNVSRVFNIRKKKTTKEN